MKKKLTLALMFVARYRSVLTTILGILAGIALAAISRKEPTVLDKLVLEIDEDHAKKMLADGGSMVFDNIKVNGQARVRIIKHPEE